MQRFGAWESRSPRWNTTAPRPGKPGRRTTIVPPPATTTEGMPMVAGGRVIRRRTVARRCVEEHWLRLVNGRDLKVAMVWARYAHDAGCGITVGLRRVAREACYNERTVMKARGNLVAAGRL